MDPSSSSSTSWYFVLATVLPVLATILALVWGFYYTSVKKRKSEKQLKGSFGYKLVKNERDKISTSTTPEEESVKVFDDVSMNNQKPKEDKRPLIDDDDDDALKVSDVEIPKLEDNFPEPRKKRADSKKSDKSVSDDDDDDDEDDQFDYSEIPGKLKSSKFVKATKELEKSMTDEQKNEEAEIRRQQLDAIFKLMREQEEKFGLQSGDDLQEQMKLYAL